MLPVVAEIVFVADAVAGCCENVTDPHLPFIGGAVLQLKARIRIPLTARGEAMKMSIFPAHGHLDNAVESVERDVQRQD